MSGGAVVGSMIGGVLYLAEDYASCPAVCAWSYGTMINANTCSVPNDRVSYMNAEAAASAAREAVRIAELNQQMSDCASQTEMRWDALTATCVSIFNVPPII